MARVRIAVMLTTDSGRADHPTEQSDASKNIVQSMGHLEQGGTELALRFSLELEPVGIVNRAVQDGIGESGIGKASMPTKDIANTGLGGVES